MLYRPCYRDPMFDMDYIVDVHSQSMMIVVVLPLVDWLVDWIGWLI